MTQQQPTRSVRTRRSFLAASAAALNACQKRLTAADLPPFAAIAFDGFAVFDAGAVFKSAMELFPQQGEEVVRLWRARQFEYTWLRTMTGQYADFLRITEDALVFTAHSLQLDLDRATTERLTSAYMELPCWPEVPEVLALLKSTGFKLAILSNMTAKMLQASVRQSRLDGSFDSIISLDSIKSYKPTRRAYSLAMKTLREQKEKILFVPSSGWDAYGAKAFGYPVYWVNRQDEPAEELGTKPDAEGSTLIELGSWLSQRLGTSFP